MVGCGFDEQHTNLAKDYYWYMASYMLPLINKWTSEYPGICRVVHTLYLTRIQRCTILVVLVSVSNIKIFESISEKRVFILSVSADGIPLPISYIEVHKNKN
jgi:hypothetical protein